MAHLFFFFFFVFISDVSCNPNEKISRGIIFQLFVVPKVLSRLEISHNFWVQYGIQRKESNKQVGLYEVENIDNANVLTIAVNPKEYFEKYKD